MSRRSAPVRRARLDMRRSHVRGLRIQAVRSPAAIAPRTRPRAPSARTRASRSCSYAASSAQSGAKLCECGSDACLHGAERLIETRRSLRIRELGEEGGLDRGSLVGREHVQRALKQAVTLLRIDRVCRPHERLAAVATVWMRIDALLPLLETQTVDGSR